MRKILKDGHRNFKIWTMLITPDLRKKYHLWRKDSTHVITIEQMIRGNRYSSQVTQISPGELKSTVKDLLKAIYQASKKISKKK